ncbi:MAG: antitoxin VapB family protein [Candidatus Aenigmarchaeota archaeon]|nr:antitoxin VapB family protein [Candidatus Aenigmarchaeota archaeon]
MGTKTISILDEAYESLKREKENEESFSDVILRLTKKGAG